MHLLCPAMSVLLDVSVSIGDGALLRRILIFFFLHINIYDFLAVPLSSLK